MMTFNYALAVYLSWGAVVALLALIVRMPAGVWHERRPVQLDNPLFERSASSFAIMLFPDRARGFAELHRVTRPGGRTVVSGWTGPDRFEAFDLFLSALNAAFPDMPPAPAPPSVFSLANPARFAAEMEAAGFAEVEVDFVARDLEVSDFHECWEMFTIGAPPIQALLDRMGPESGLRLKDSLRSIVGDRYGDGAIRSRTWPPSGPAWWCEVRRGRVPDSEGLSRPQTRLTSIRREPTPFRYPVNSIFPASGAPGFEPGIP